MTFQQTKAWYIDLEHATNLAKEHRFLSDREEIANQMIERTIKYRGEEYAKALFRKANQRVKYRFYDI